MTPRPRRQEGDPAIQAETPEFPSARYFQIHFEQLYQLIQDLRERLDATTRELAALRAQTKSGVERAQAIREEPESPARRSISALNDTPAKPQAKTEIDHCPSKRGLTNRGKSALG
jgi:regulator of replication initiation timing